MRISTIVLFSLALGPAALAETYRIDQAEANFVAKGRPGFLKIEGTGAVASGVLVSNETSWTGRVTASLKPIKTGIDLRDEHMHQKYLQTDQYPEAILVIDQGKWEDGECSFAGKLEVKAISKPVQGECDLSETSEGLKGEVVFAFSLQDYPVGVPSYLGITVADEVKVTAKFVAKKAPAAH